MPAILSLRIFRSLITLCWPVAFFRCWFARCIGWSGFSGVGPSIAEPGSMCREMSEAALTATLVFRDRLKA